MLNYSLQRSFLRSETRKRTDKTIIFLHNFRTAGTALTRNIHVSYSIPTETLAINLPSTHPRWIKNLSRDDLLKIKYISGHMAFGIHRLLPHNQFTYISLVRDPIDRILSVYHVLRSEKGKGHPLQPICLEYTLEDLHDIKLYEDLLKRNYLNIHIAYEYFNNYQARMFSNINCLCRVEECKRYDHLKRHTKINEALPFGEDTYLDVLNNIYTHFSYIGFSTPTDMEKDWLFLPNRFGWIVPPEEYFMEEHKVNFSKNRITVSQLSETTQQKIRNFNQYDYRLFHYIQTNQDMINHSAF